MKKIISVLVLAFTLIVNTWALDWWNYTKVTKVEDSTFTIETNPDWSYQGMDKFDVEMCVKVGDLINEFSSFDDPTFIADITELASHTMNTGKQCVGLKWLDGDVIVLVTYISESGYVYVAAGKANIYKR